MENSVIKNKNLALIFCLFFASCAGGKIDPFDNQTGLTRGEIKDFLYKKIMNS